MVPEVWRQCAESQLNFQIPGQWLDLGHCIIASLSVCRARHDAEDSRGQNDNKQFEKIVRVVCTTRDFMSYRPFLHDNSSLNPSSSLFSS
jgi:hypothetical protein